MSFHVTKTWNNGYRCCCHRTWVTTKEFPTLEAAMKEFPLEWPGREGDEGMLGDIELEEVLLEGPLKPEDAEFHTLIAKATLSWIHARGYNYRYSAWHGFYMLPDGTDETFYKEYGIPEGKTWDGLREEAEEMLRKRRAP